MKERMKEIKKSNKIRDILLAISLIGVVGLSIGVIFLKNKSNNITLEEEIIDEKVGNRIEFDDVKKKLLDRVLGLKTIQDKLNDVLNITKKEEFDKKEEENKFKILKDEILKVLGEYIEIILKSEENKKNKDEYFQIISEFKKLITVEFLKEKIGHIKFEDEGSKSTGIFKTIEEEKEEIYNLFIQYFENLKNEEKKYFLSSKEKDKENEFAKLGISKKFKDIFSWFKEPKSFDNKFSQMENIEQIKLIEEKSNSEKLTLIKENKEKKQYTVNGNLLTDENIKLSETNEQFLERKVKYEFIKYFEKNIINMKNFDFINNFVQNEKFNDELIKKMFEINKENETKKDGSSFEFKFDGKETFKNEIFIKVLNEFDEEKDNAKKIKRIIEIINAEVKENINFDVLLNVDFSNLSSNIKETQEVIDLLKQIQERSKSEVVVFSNLLKTSLNDENTDGTLGKKLKDFDDKFEVGFDSLDSKIIATNDKAEKFQTSFFDIENDGTLGKKLKDLDDRKYKINLRSSLLKLRFNINTLILEKTTDFNLKINQNFIVIYKKPQRKTKIGTWTSPEFYILQTISNPRIVINVRRWTTTILPFLNTDIYQEDKVDFTFGGTFRKAKVVALYNKILNNTITTLEENKLKLLTNIFEII